MGVMSGIANLDDFLGSFVTEALWSVPFGLGYGNDSRQTGPSLL